MKQKIKRLLALPLIFAGVAQAGGAGGIGVVSHGDDAYSYHPQWNVSLFGGRQFSDKLAWGGVDYDTEAGDAYGIAISRNVAPRTSIGFELSRTKSFYSGFSNYIAADAAMFTAKYDFVNTGRVAAYGGVGVGAVRPEYKQVDGQKFSETVAGGQLMLGVRAAFTPHASLFLEARHIGTFQDFSIAGAGAGAGQPAGAEAEYDGNNVVIGLQYSY